MKSAKRLLMVAGAVALAGMLSMVLAPKAVHAVVSTLVTVSNTSANPVPVTQGLDLAEEPFATSVCTDSSSGSFCAGIAAALALGPSTLPSSFLVPSSDSAGNSVKALVIQFVSGSCDAITANLATTVPANAVNGVTTAVNPLSLMVQSSVGGSSTPAPIVGQSTSIVARPGSTVALLASLPTSGECFLTLNGYLAH